MSHELRNEVSSSKEKPIRILDLASEQKLGRMLIIESLHIQEKWSGKICIEARNKIHGDQ